MNKIYEFEDVVFVFDGCSRFDGVSHAKLKDAMGLIPHFILGGEGSIKERLESGYVWPVFWMDQTKSEFKIGDNGEYDYPEDPTLYPLATFRIGDEILHVYQYGIIALKEGAGWNMARMD